MARAPNLTGNATGSACRPLRAGLTSADQYSAIEDGHEEGRSLDGFTLLLEYVQGML